VDACTFKTLTHRVEKQLSGLSSRRRVLRVSGGVGQGTNETAGAREMPKTDSVT
jgi:hypothetical protein